MDRVDPLLEILGIPTLWRRRDVEHEDSRAVAVDAAALEAVASKASAPDSLSSAPIKHLAPGADAQRFDAAPPAVTPAAAPLAELDFDALKSQVSVCTQCRLCETRTQAVFGVGDAQADWMIVGEAPGANEDLQGEPFVGQAGKLLDNMFHALGLGRTSGVFIANVIKCRPPGNRDPQPDEVAACEGYLKRQIALVQPRIIVALGRFAAQTILRSEKNIGAMRGVVHSYEGVPVIVTYHPAYLLRSLREKAKAWEDLCLARATYQALPPIVQVSAEGDASTLPSALTDTTKPVPNGTGRG